MKLVPGTAGEVSLPDSATPPHPPYTYLAIALGLLPGARVLSDAGLECAVAHTFLCAHVLECSLKAYLSSVGVSDQDLKGNSVRHNLPELWRRSVEAGLPVPIKLPEWVEQLGRLHDAPYFLRYSTRVNGIVMPAMQPMFAALSEVVLLCARPSLQSVVAPHRDA